MSPLLASRPRIFFGYLTLFIVLLFIFPCTNAKLGNTSATPPSILGGCRTSCGHHDIKFPIGIDPGCGTPQFFMSCINGSTLIIQIDSKDFLVDNINYNNKTLIMRDPLMSDCAHLNSFSAGLDINLANKGLMLGRDTILLLNCFSFTQTVDFLTNQYDCHGPTCLAFIGGCHNHDFFTSCCRVIDPGNRIDLYTMQCTSYTSIYSPQDPIYSPTSWSYGIEIQWNNLPSELMEDCSTCQAKKGICGYDPREEQKFRCMCHSSLGCKGCFPGSCPIERTRLVIGITTAGIFLIVAGALCLFLRPWHVRFRKIRSNSIGYSQDYFGSDKQTGMELVHVIATMTGPIPLTLFSYKELSRATEGFSEDLLLGDGGYGIVYKAKFCDGRLLAVKRLNHLHHRRLEHFYNEVRILSQVKHPNLVQLEGFCVEGRDLLLVYEYVCNGTLEEHIHGHSKQLKWEKRLNIACEIANALEYLHFAVSPPIYHRDVKTSNILLDEELCAKVADFGLSRLVPMEATHVSTGPQGTPGYVDPEYHQCYQVTDKSDVFSFGVVLLELISSKKAVDLSRPHTEINLSSLAIDRIQKGAMDELLDEEIMMGSSSCESAHEVGKLAFRCIALERRARPDMREVSAQLELIRSNLQKQHLNTLT